MSHNVYWVLVTLLAAKDYLPVGNAAKLQLTHYEITVYFTLWCGLQN